MGKRGPKPAVVDWNLCENLAAVFCTQRELAGACRLDIDTLAKACKREHGKLLSAWMDEKRDIGRRKLRLVQMQAALKGNITMMIWLGKQLLGQTDKVDQVDKYWASKKGKEELIAMGKQALEIVQSAQGAVQLPAAPTKEATT